jgi:predicted phosphodiesterase
MRTLVVSDLHLGAHSGNDVLRYASHRAALLAAVADCDRLLILGDLLELRHGPEREALAAADPILAEVGAALRPGGEVLLSPGNHDHRLLDPWIERRARDGSPPPLGLETEVQIAPGDALDRIARRLAPAPLRVLYPGVWLRDDVYAMHGHYADVHLTLPTLERLGAGVMGRVLGAGGAGPASAEDYEAVLAPMYAWIDAVAQRVDPSRGGHLNGGSVRGWQAMTGPGRRSLRGRVMALGYPALIAALNRAGIGPLCTELSGAALRRAGLRGAEEAAARLGVSADHIIFGHTHRAGPLPGDARAEWVTAAGARLFNSGCWVREPSFLGADPASSPYRVGFAVWVGGSGPPELVNLLDRVAPGVTAPAAPAVPASPAAPAGPDAALSPPPARA